MYTSNRASIYEYEVFPLIEGQKHQDVTVDVTSYGFPPEALAVELLLGCRSWTDGSYVAAFDGATGGLDRIAVYPTALIRNQWSISRGRVELEGSSFLLRVRPVGDSIQVIAILKGYFTEP
jgi:hypothetical protein